MTQLTLGQRIAARRKLLNYSQEALAEQLDVSRQAVSKWESDGAIPEIDKLITLGKIYDVSVGWLLGVEEEPNDRSGELSETDIKMVEQIVARYHTPKKATIGKIAVVCILIITGLTTSFLYYRDQLIGLKENNASTQEKIEILSEDNQSLQEQVLELNQLLTQQAEENLLLSKVRLKNNVSDDLQEVSIVQYLYPKVYQENNTAYISIENPSTGYNEMVECPWDRDHYIFRHELPAVDGYQFQFLLVNDYGYETEDLNIRDQGIAKLGTFCTFHIDPAHPQYTKMLRNEHSYLSDKATSYSFNAPIHTPHIFAKTAVAYKDIHLELTHNGTAIWEKSFKEAFKEAAKGITMNAAANSVLPEIEVQLPQLSEGDILELTLYAETVNGGATPQNYSVLLDHVVIAKDTNT